MPAIVTVNVSEQIAPTPSTLQQTGVFISQGATTTAAGTRTLLTQLSSLASILTGALPLSALTWSSGVVTATASAAHNITIGDSIELTISGALPSGYNGTYLCTATTSTQFTYSLVSNPGTASTFGTWTPEDVTELNAMNSTFFGQGNNAPVYVLELGLGSVTEGVTYLGTWLANNPYTIYTACVPREWDGNSSFLSLIAEYEAPTSMFYFFVTTTISTYSSYTALMKCVMANVEAPSIPTTEFDAAAWMYQVLSMQPSNTNKVPPFAFRYLFGVTPYPTAGNNTLLTQLQAANINYVATGAEGGISNTITWLGDTLDGNDFLYWYSVDWMQIQSNLSLSNAVINGSNNPINPLYYNQYGINSLQSVESNVVQDAITFGLVTGTLTLTTLDSPTLDQQINLGTYANQAVVNCVPFVTYAEANPGDYKIRTYRGMSVIFIPATGFIAIVLNLLVSQFINL